MRPRYDSHTMSEQDPLERLAALADELGPALVPPGHDELLKSIAETARSLFGAAACSIALLDDPDAEEPSLTFRVAVGRGAEAVLDLAIPATQGIAGFVLHSGQPLVVDDVRGDPRFAGDVAGHTGYVPTTIVASPLETDRGTIGVLEVLDPDGSSIATSRGMELLGHFATLAALSLEGAGVFQSLGRTLFGVAAVAAEGRAPDLAEALRTATRGARKTDRDLAELAAIFVELRRLGPAEREAATKLLLTFLRYVSAEKGTTA
jgi:GAF domain-containing protein